MLCPLYLGWCRRPSWRPCFWSKCCCPSAVYRSVWPTKYFPSNRQTIFWPGAVGLCGPCSDTTHCCRPHSCRSPRNARSAALWALNTRIWPGRSWICRPWSWCLRADGRRPPAPSRVRCQCIWPMGFSPCQCSRPHSTARSRQSRTICSAQRSFWWAHCMTWCRRAKWTPLCADIRVRCKCPDTVSGVSSAPVGRRPCRRAARSDRPTMCHMSPWPRPLDSVAAS